MSFFDAGKAYVFSPMEVMVTLDGSPLANAEVIRRWEINKIEEDRTTTDENGRFSFSEIRRRSAAQALPIEFVVAQQIVVIVENKEHEIWSNSKHDTGLNAELGGIPLNLTCELNGEEIMYRDFGPALLTRCTWNDK